MELLSGVLLSAALLGATHAVEPDHAAGIAALVDGGSPARAAAVAASFAGGHVALVVAWLLAGSLLVDRLPSSIGTVALSAALLVVAAVTAVDGASTLRGRPRHPLVSLTDGAGSRPAYLALAGVGALFTLSPPLSMLAFLSGVLPQGEGVAWLAVATYGVAITTVMTLFGAGAGVLFGALRERGRAVHAVATFATAGVAAALGLSVLL